MNAAQIIIAEWGRAQYIRAIEVATGLGGDRRLVRELATLTQDREFSSEISKTCTSAEG